MVSLDIAALVNFLLPGAILLYCRTLGVGRKRPAWIDILIVAGIYFVVTQLVFIWIEGKPQPLPTMESLPKSHSDATIWAVVLCAVPALIGTLWGLYTGRDTSTDNRPWYLRVMRWRHPFRTWHPADTVWDEVFRIDKVRQVDVYCKDGTIVSGYVGRVSTDSVRRDMLVCPIRASIRDLDGYLIRGDDVRTIEIKTVDPQRRSTGEHTNG